MTGTLYALGCSHTAGHSLSPDITREMIKKFYERYKVSDFHVWQEKYSPVIREEQVRNHWYPMLDNSSDYNWPENTYAAHIAKKKNMKYVNLAVSGSGIDMVVTKFKQIEKNITPDDIVISDAPPVFRYTTSKGKFAYNLHLTKHNEEIVPSTDAMKIFYEGCVHYLMNNSVRFVQVLPSNHQGIDFNIPYINIQSLHDLCVNEMKEHRYPSGHMWKESHEEFANRIINGDLL